MNNYGDAFTEVYEIISYLNDEEYNKIPKEVVDAIYENRNKEYEYWLDESIPLEDQEMLPETKAILFNLFRDYLSYPWQKEKIIKMQREERLRKEEIKRKKYNSDNIFKNQSNKNKKQSYIENEKEKNLVDSNKENFIQKIINKLRKFLL